jgi:predicted transposase/invertase (TIGR01784 family)
MKHRIDPIVDCVFKAILGSEENKNLLIHFLNSVLEPEILIAEIEIQNPYNEREFIADKLTVVDVKAIDDNKRQYQIEIQLVLHTAIAERMLYTWSKIYNTQLQKGDSFEKLNPVISIWVLNENLFNNVKDFHLPFVIYNKKNDLILSKDLEIHLLQLPKWQRNSIENEKDRWLYLFKEGKNIDVDKPPKELHTNEMKQAMDVLNKFSENQDDYSLYQNRLESILLENTLVNGLAKAKQQYKQALQAKEKALQDQEKERIAKEEEKKAKENALQEKKEVQVQLDNLLLKLKQRDIEI